MENLIIEAVSIYGEEIYYLPRTSVNQDEIFGEDTLQRFSQQYPIEMYLNNIEGFDGNGELFSKFGITVNDQATFVVSKRRWEESVSYQTNDLQLPLRPAEGDLLYFPKTGSFFEIKFVKADNPFFQLGRLYLYTMTCELFIYSSERIDIEGDQTADIGSLASKLNTINGPLVGSQDTYTRGITTMTGNQLMSVAGNRIIRVDIDTKSRITENDDNQDFENEGKTFLSFDEQDPFGAYSERI